MCRINFFNKNKFTILLHNYLGEGQVGKLSGFYKGDLPYWEQMPWAITNGWQHM